MLFLCSFPAGTTGTNAAANTATSMLRSSLNIPFCLMVGVGGGAPGVPSDDPCKYIQLEVHEDNLGKRNILGPSQFVEDSIKF